MTEPLQRRSRRLSAAVGAGVRRRARAKSNTRGASRPTSPNRWPPPVSTGCSCRSITAALKCRRPSHRAYSKRLRSGRCIVRLGRVHRRHQRFGARAASGRCRTRDLPRSDDAASAAYSRHPATPRSAADGFTVNGRWQWGSGSQNAQWILGGCTISRRRRTAAHEQRRAAQPHARVSPHPGAFPRHLARQRACAARAASTSKCATRSCREARAVGYLIQENPPRPLYQFPQFALLALGIAAVALGIARGAIDELDRACDNQSARGQFDRV